MHCVSVRRAPPKSVRDRIIGLVTLLMSAQPACAATAVERGSYLVNTIMACGNCHTPRDANGAFVSGKRDGHRLNAPMAFAFYAGLSDADTADIIAYLRTLK